MEYHAIEDAQSWHAIRDILAERAKAGVEVRVFYDDMGSLGFINTDFVKRTEKYGIQCRVFNPFAPGLNLFLNNRDHRKITVTNTSTSRNPSSTGRIPESGLKETPYRALQ